MANGSERLDPELEAGRALRRLRLARDWSQEEVASRMRTYGYDFHQTTIAKIEAAARPLRVRELVDFAALFGVEVQQLIFPPSDSLEEIEQEMAEVRVAYQVARERAAVAEENLSRAEAALTLAQREREVYRAEISALVHRMGFLNKQRGRFARPRPEQEHR